MMKYIKSIIDNKIYPNNLISENNQSENSDELQVLMMKYQDIHQRVDQHVDFGRHDTVQALLIIGAILTFSLNFYYNTKYDAFVNIALCLVLPVIPFNMIASILTINIKMCVYGEYLNIIEKKINAYLYYKNNLNLSNYEDINWEKWRMKHGVANDKIVFFDGANLYMLITVGAIVISLIRLLYINDYTYTHIRLWLFLYPLPIAFFITIIITLIKRYNFYKKRALNQIDSYEIVKIDVLDKSGFSKVIHNLKILLMFIGFYITILIFLLIFIPFSFYAFNENALCLENQMIAHRGLHNEEYPENTLLAFQNAIDYGYAIELDVWISKDNIPIVIHDNNLKRLCQIDKNITDLTIKEIKKIKIDGSSDISTLQEALNLIDGQVPVIIEIKKYFPTDNENQLIANILSDYNGIYTIQSFSPVPLYWFKQNYPTIPRGQLLADWKFFSNQYVYCIRDNIFNMISTPNYIGYDRNAIKYASLDGAKKHNIPIVSWLFYIGEMDFGDNLEYDGYLIEEPTS